MLKLNLNFQNSFRILKSVISYLYVYPPFPDLHKTLIDLLQVFFMSLAYDSLPQEAELGEGFLYLEDLWKVT